MSRHRELDNLANWPPPSLARFEITSSDIKAPSGPGAAGAYTWRGYWVAFTRVTRTTESWVEPT